MHEKERVCAALWQKASDLRASKMAEKESLRKQLKEGSTIAQVLVRVRVCVCIV